MCLCLTQLVNYSFGDKGGPGYSEIESVVAGLRSAKWNHLVHAKLKICHMYMLYSYVGANKPLKLIDIRITIGLDGLLVIKCNGGYGYVTFFRLWIQSLFTFPIIFSHLTH